jgi:glycosyltransferase involved in cell wall biosynthesis
MLLPLTIFVPVYNEEATLQILLDKLAMIKLKQKAQLIIVNDGSKDGSQAIINKWVESKPVAFNIDVIDHKKNRGKGAGIQTALKQATGKYFVIQDADLEYDPAEIPQILDAALRNDAPVVYGSRFLGTITNMPRPNYYANRVYNMLIRLLYNVKMTDMHTCYKMVKTDLFKDLDIHSDGFGYAAEVISKLLNRKIAIMEVPINFVGRTAKEGKKINARDGIECLLQMVKYRFIREKA